MSYLTLLHIENNTIQFRLYYTNVNRKKKLVIETNKEEIVEKYKNKQMRDLSPELKEYSYGYYTEDGKKHIPMHIMRFPNKIVKGYRKYWCAENLEEAGYVDFVPETFIKRN